MKSKRFILGVCLLLALLLLGISVLLGSWYFASNYYYDRDYRNQERIAKAYIYYTRAKKEFPQSMADLVNTGYLPEEAYYYKEPPGPFRHVVNFKEGSYVVFTAQTNSVEDLKVIGRRVIKDGKEEIVFDPVINLDVGNALRDKLRQIPVQSK